jgi:uncharacterized membrane protein YjfL (UPF0719 family)
MELDLGALGAAAAAAAIFSVVGFAFFGVAFLVMRLVTPFSIRKEIEEDQNKALGILIGSVLVGIAMIVAASLEGETIGGAAPAAAGAAGAAAASTGVDWGALLHGAVVSVIFSAIGLALFGLAFFVATRVAPFSIRKEIEDDENVALALVLGAINVGIAWIVAAAVGG